jgi:hypothetical protein
MRKMMNEGQTGFRDGITVKDRHVSRDDGFFLLPTGNAIACCGRITKIRTRYKRARG